MRRGLLDALLPPLCLACGAGVGPGRSLCVDCAAELPRNRPACQGCALPLPAASSLGRCGRCLRRAPPYASCHTVFRYADPVDRWLGRLKFAQDLAAGRLLGAELAEALRVWPHLDAIDALLPMPLHAQRLRERGYNQVLELARGLRGPPLRAHWLQRRRATVAQLGLNAGQRRRNLRGAFHASPEVAGKRLLLLDDVITTGSTVGEATRCLLRAGAAEVHVWALARVV